MSYKMGSHVGRSLLEEASRFSHVGKAINEYVKNSMQYTDSDTIIEINVNKNADGVKISDNARGMDEKTIRERFLVLHQKNIDREEGRFGRGEYGTGKIAGLGIGKILRIRTIKDGLLNEFEIREEDCGDSQDEVPVHTIHKNKKTSEKHGTTVEIKKTHGKIKRKIVEDYIVSKTLTETIYKYQTKVFLDGKELKKIEIEYSDVKTFKPTEEEREVFGDAKVDVKIATRILDKEFMGINVFCKGINKAFIKNPNGSKSDVLFGQAVCDKLIDQNLRPKVFDSSRSEQMNPESPVAAKFEAFVLRSVDKVRKELEKEDAERKKRERDEALEKEKLKMQELFNEDFKEQQIEFQKQIAKAKGQIDEKQDYVPELGETKIKKGNDFNVEVVEGDGPGGVLPDYPSGEGNVEKSSGNDRSGNLKQIDQKSDIKGKNIQSKKRNKGGGFNFDFDNLGKDENRAKYKEDKRQIIINLQHPLIRKYDILTKQDRKNPKFLRAAYEAAAYEYARVVTSQKLNSEIIDDSVIEGIEELNDRLETMLKKISNLNLFDE